jgi:hypothetical protein
VRHNRTALPAAVRTAREKSLWPYDVISRFAGYIYRACIKLDVTDREGLALVIRRGRGG